jgi:ornithine cyclodeaminase/alanine dehydrogenase-like protein (mu-crystallin family)
VLLLTNEDVEPLLTMPECIETIEQAWKAFGEGKAVDIPRQDAIVPNSRENAAYDLKTMSGSWPGAGIAAIRLNSDIVTWPTINGTLRRVKLPVSDPGASRYNGSVLLFSTDSGQLLCMLNDGMIQKTRVGATSGVAAKYLARKNAKTMGLLGTGLQAGGQLLAMSSVRQLEEIKVYGPTYDKCVRFAEEFSQLAKVKVRAVKTPEEAADAVDILVTATNSLSPTVKLEWLKPGMHLSSIRRNELPKTVFERVDRLVVNAHEAGSNYIADGCPDVPELRQSGQASTGVDNIERFPELKDLAAGKAKGRQSDSEITCFHNYQGLGLQFAALGALIYREARKRKLGLEIDDKYFTQTVHP